MTKYNVFSGGFDPITPGHVSIIAGSFRAHGRETIIILNTDEWLMNKKGAVFMPFKERKFILENIIGVNRVVTQIDTDTTVAKTLRFICENSPKDEFVFVNSGDKKTQDVPEYEVVRKMNNLTYSDLVSEFRDVHSSTYLNKWVNENSLDHVFVEMAKRPWGHWKTLDEFEDIHHIWHKIKILVVDPGKSLSRQYHNYRSEFWLVLEGVGLLSGDEGDVSQQMFVGSQANIPVESWHRLSNPSTSQRLVVLEVQTSTQKNVKCTEEDIIRSE